MALGLSGLLGEDHLERRSDVTGQLRDVLVPRHVGHLAEVLAGELLALESAALDALDELRERFLARDHDAARLDGVRHGSDHGRSDAVDRLFQEDAHTPLDLRHDGVTLLRQVARVDHDQVDQWDTSMLERRDHAFVGHIGGHADDHRFG